MIYKRGLKDMKKRYIFAIVVAIIVGMFFAGVLFSSKDDSKLLNSNYPRIGQKMWTYNMNKHEWRNYQDSDDELSKEEIILQVRGFEGNGGYMTYNLLTGNGQVPKEDAWMGEGSQEFLIGKSLYSYFPKSFEYYEIIFNGVKFVPRKLSQDEVTKIFKNVNVIKVSQLHKGTHVLKYDSKNNQYMILNDNHEDFYKYYIVPNDSKNLEIGEFSNQFKINGETDIKIQRLEGCSKSYPCYEIKVSN